MMGRESAIKYYKIVLMLRCPNHLIYSLYYKKDIRNMCVDYILNRRCNELIKANQAKKKNRKLVIIIVRI